MPEGKRALYGRRLANSLVGVVGAGRVARSRLPSTLSPESKIYTICWVLFVARGPFVRYWHRSTGAVGAQSMKAFVRR
jgi:hypothetical protein